MKNTTPASIKSKDRVVAVGFLTGALLATSIGAASSNSWTGLSIMTIGILSIGLILGFDIGRKAGGKGSKEAPA